MGFVADNDCCVFDKYERSAITATQARKLQRRTDYKDAFQMFKKEVARLEKIRADILSYQTRIIYKVTDGTIVRVEHQYDPIIQETLHGIDLIAKDLLDHCIEMDEEFNP